jgi:predicted outer membrane protein
VTPGSTNAITKGVTLSSAPTEEQRAELEALRALGATELDRTFLTRTIATHEERVALFARQAKGQQRPGVQDVCRELAGRSDRSRDTASER